MIVNTRKVTLVSCYDQEAFINTIIENKLDPGDCIWLPRDTKERREIIELFAGRLKEKQLKGLFALDEMKH